MIGGKIGASEGLFFGDFLCDFFVIFFCVRGGVMGNFLIFERFLRVVWEFFVRIWVFCGFEFMGNFVGKDEV